MAQREYRARALIADIPPAHPKIARALPDFELEFVTSLDGALAALRDRPFDLVVVGIDLHESRALDVMREVRRLRPGTPVVCVRAAESRYRLEESTLEGFRVACEELGALGLINFFKYAAARNADAAIRAEFEKLLGPKTKTRKAKP